MTTTATTAARRRNRRGEGGRLREDLVCAAISIIETKQPGQLSLRGIARRAGVAPTSVYLHFTDVDHVLAAVAERGFADLNSVTVKAAAEVPDPLEALLRRCHAYCRFALDRPRLYQVMFQAGLPVAQAADPASLPGARTLAGLARAVRRCQAAGAGTPEDSPVRLACLIWAAVHGIVVLRSARPQFPWPPVEESVSDLVRRVLAVAVS